MNTPRTIEISLLNPKTLTLLASELRTQRDALASAYARGTVREHKPGAVQRSLARHDQAITAIDAELADFAATRAAERLERLREPRSVRYKRLLDQLQAKLQRAQQDPSLVWCRYDEVRKLLDTCIRIKRRYEQALREEGKL